MHVGIEGARARGRERERQQHTAAGASASDGARARGRVRQRQQHTAAGASADQSRSSARGNYAESEERAEQGPRRLCRIMWVIVCSNLKVHRWLCVPRCARQRLTVSSKSCHTRMIDTRKILSAPQQRTRRLCGIMWVIVRSNLKVHR